MTTTYTPKKPYMAKTRIQKEIKDLLTEQKRDRELALETYGLLKENLDEQEEERFSNDIVARMVDCLKVAQTARNNSVKLLSLAEKLLSDPNKTTTGKNKDTSTGNPLFD